MAPFWAHGIHQIWGDGLLAIATAFVEAARSLPQPFQIVESGNSNLPISRQSQAGMS